MARDGGDVAARDRPRDRLRGILRGERLDGALGQRQERGAGLGLGRAGGGLERAHRLGEERDLGASREDCGGVIEGARSGGSERKHVQRLSQRVEHPAHVVVGAFDPRGGARERIGAAARRDGAERMHRAHFGASGERGSERGEIERAGEMGDDLSRTQEALGDELGAERTHRRVGH